MWFSRKSLQGGSQVRFDGYWRLLKIDPGVVVLLLTWIRMLEGFDDWISMTTLRRTSLSDRLMDFSYALGDVWNLVVGGFGFDMIKSCTSRLCSSGGKHNLDGL